MRAELWSLPGPARWAAAILQDQSDGRSGVVICPTADEPAGLVEHLEVISPRGRFYMVVPSQDLYASEALRALSVLRALNIPDIGDTPSASAVARHADMGGLFVVVDARAQPVEDQSGWIDFAAHVAAACNDLPRRTRPSLWVLAAPGQGGLPVFPAADVTIRVRWWWGVIGPVDGVIHAMDSDVQSDLVAVATEIMRWDLSLVDIVRSWDGTIDGLARLELPCFAGAAQAIVRPVPAGHRPASDLIDGWKNGLVQSWDGQVSLHIAAEMAHRPRALVSRVWLAQVARLTPLIEFERVRLAESLAGELGTQGILPRWVGQDIASLDIGPLSACYFEHRSRSASRLRLRLLRDLRDARNSLAHRRPLALSTIKSLREQMLRDQRD